MARIIFSCASSKPLGLLPTVRYNIKAIDPAEMILLICLSWCIHTNLQCSAASLLPTYALLEQVTPRSKNILLLALKEDRNLPPAQCGAHPRMSLLGAGWVIEG